MLSPPSTISVPISTSLTPTSDVGSLTSAESMELQSLRNQVERLQRHIHIIESRQVIGSDDGSNGGCNNAHPAKQVSVAGHAEYATQVSTAAVVTVSKALDYMPHSTSNHDCPDVLAAHPGQRVHLKSRCCTESRIVMSNGRASTHHDVPAEHVNALFEFCLSNRTGKCFCSEESNFQVLMFVGFNIDSDQYASITGEQCDCVFQRWGLALDHCGVCLGFLISDSQCESDEIILAECSLDCNPILLIETYCILGLPAQRLAHSDDKKRILEYEHPHGFNFLTCDDFARLIEGRWISDGSVSFHHVTDLLVLTFCRVLDWYADYLYDAARIRSFRIEKSLFSRKLLSEISSCAGKSYVFVSLRFALDTHNFHYTM
jgi:hypothetical protein